MHVPHLTEALQRGDAGLRFGVLRLQLHLLLPLVVVERRLALVRGDVEF